MIRIRKAEERGHADHGWLDTYHTFSFADYFDPENMGFRTLRVINEDRVQPGEGFPTHGHRDMEIVTYVLEGALEHKDSMGSGGVIRPGQVQRMTAGKGVLHSEYNASDQEPVHFLQIWLLPERAGLQPGYEEKTIPEAEKKGRLRLVASRDGRDGSATVHQDVALYAAVLDSGEKVAHDLQPGRHAWVQVAWGQVLLDGRLLEAGDGAALSGESRLELEGRDRSEVLVFDLG
jgi:quercetin 2,3-dioxygenase